MEVPRPLSPGTNDAAKPRLLVLTSTFPRWPNDTEPEFILDLAKRLTNDFEVRVLAPHASGSLATERLEGVEVRRFRYMWPSRLQRLAYGGILPNLGRNRLLWLQVPPFLAAELRAAYRTARDWRPAVIHAHWILPQGLVAVIVGRSLGIPVLLTEHGGAIHGLGGPAAAALQRWVLRRASGLTGVSQDVVGAMRSLLTQETSVAALAMGVDTARFTPRARDRDLRQRLGAGGPLVLFVGRLAEKKGLRYLIEAMPAILERSPNATLVVAGDGPLRPGLEALADDSGVAGRVRFVGALPQSDLPRLYASADVTVLPSIVAAGGDREGLPVVLCEAMASGCPVVATPVGGIVELVSHGETGLLVPERDAAALAEAVLSVLEGRERARELAAAGRRVVRLLDKDRVSREYGRILRSLAAG